MDMYSIEGLIPPLFYCLIAQLQWHSLTHTQLDQLKREYATLMMDSMDIKSMEQFVFDTIYDNLEMAKEDELKEDIKDLCGDDVLTDLLNNL